jgi:hypothetical protein
VLELGRFLGGRFLYLATRYFVPDRDPEAAAEPPSEIRNIGEGNAAFRATLAGSFDDS